MFPRRPFRGRYPYLVWVSVVVVVVGPGTVVCCDVVVVLRVGSEAQPEINARATTAKQETIIFFMMECLFDGYFKSHDYAPVNPRLWGVTLPDTDFAAHSPATLKATATAPAAP